MTREEAMADMAPDCEADGGWSFVENHESRSNRGSLSPFPSC